MKKNPDMKPFKGQKEALKFIFNSRNYKSKGAYAKTLLSLFGLVAGIILVIFFFLKQSSHHTEVKHKIKEHHKIIAKEKKP